VLTFAQWGSEQVKLREKGDASGHQGSEQALLRDSVFENTYAIQLAEKMRRVAMMNRILVKLEARIF
jgi:hypothetical protein